MHCQTAQEQFSDFVSGEIEPALKVSLENHLTGCAQCREEVAGLRHVWATLEELPVVEPPPFFHENLMSRLNAETAVVEETVARRRALWDWRALFSPRSLAFAALVLIVLMAGATLAHTQRAALDPIGWVIQMFQPKTTEDTTNEGGQNTKPPAPAGKPQTAPNTDAPSSTGQ